MDKQVILASQSAYKKAQFETLRIPFETFSPDIDETRNENETPADFVRRLSVEKARKASELFPEAICIGADQCVSIGNDILGKSGTYEGAAKNLLKLQGKTHQLFTGVCVISGVSEIYDVEIHNMHMRKLLRDEIARYVVSEQPFDCAGSYKIEGLGISLFEKIEGNDPRAIIGLPLMKIVGIFNQINFNIP
ncbi:MAG: septum formation protein Maf [Deltaproteobacteria bacterium]|nr:septum formation protein Maf [Deltaproteobacteria bacterium]